MLNRDVPEVLQSAKEIEFEGQGFGLRGRAAPKDPESYTHSNFHVFR